MHIANTVSIYANTFVAATDFQRRGWAVTPVKHQTKRPLLKNWEKGGVEEEAFAQLFCSGPVNLGIVLGEASSGLVDLDLDDPIALQLADDFLPTTNCIFGRPSNRASHRIYQVRSPGKIADFVADGETILEIRGSKHLTVFPGSVHPSGELIEFEKGFDGDPGLTEWAALETGARKIGIATLLVKNWHPGSRHRLALCASGFLRQLGWTEADVHEVIRAAARHAKDDEIFDRLECVKTTYQKEGEPISGRSELINLIGEKAVIAVERWCGSSEVQEPIVPTTTPADITTDSGASDAFAKAKSGQLIYRDDTDTWFKRDGQVFRPISYVQVQGEAKHFMQEQVGSAGFIGSTRSLLSKGKIDNLLALSRHQFRVEPGLLDECKYLVGCSDGTVLDLGTQSLIQTSALVTKTVRCRLDANADYPRFKKFLSEVFAENQSVISFLQRAVGYSLAGYLDEQCMFFLVGKGSNGKTTLLNTIQHVFGDYAATTPAQTLVASRYGNQQTNDLAKLVGIRFVTASETEKGERLAESKLKRITGGDRIRCRGLYEEFFEYDPQFKLWLATNDPPNFSGGDYSITRRIYVIEFPVTFDAASRDHGLQARLLNEASGILNWALQGYAEWRMQGLNPPKDVMLATKSYTTENDSVGQFIDACCIIEPTAKETTGKLHQAYEDWCRESGIEPLPSNSFGKELKRRDFEPIKGRRGNGWRGLKLRTDENLNTDLEAVGRVASDNDTGDSKISEADNNALQG